MPGLIALSASDSRLHGNELVPLDSGLALFDAFASHEKTLHAVDGGAHVAAGSLSTAPPGPLEPAAGSTGVEPAGHGAHNASMYEHRGNGEHPQSLERRRQLLVWRSLAVLILFGGGLGLLRLVLELVTGAPAQTVVYQLGLLALNGLLGLLVLFRLRSLRRR
jgi:hypothetical protein